MKTTQYIVAMLAGAAVLASCAKEADKQLPEPQDLITIKAEMPEDVTTKAGAHVGFSWYWGEGDKIAITGAEDTQIYTIKEGFTPKYAEFVGKPVAGDAFTITYPEKAATADWSGQTQTGNNSYAHLKYAAELAGVDNYLSFAFNPDWAAAHNGTLKQVGVMKMIIALPDTVSAVNGVSISAEDAIFFKGNGDAKVNKLELAVENAAPDANHTFIAWFTTSWHQAVVPANTVLTVSVKTKDAPISKEVTFTSEAVIMSGKVNVFTLDATGWKSPNHYTSGKGTVDDPWIITTPEQMAFMADDMAAGETRYFKLGNSIDMKDIEWKPLNAASPYDKKIDFNGAGYTISNFKCVSTAEAPVTYPSFFGVLYGNCYNVKFINATVETNAKGVGILGGYGGTTDKPCYVENVHVQGTITSSAGNNVGGFFGTAREASIVRSSADVVINSKGQLNGGLIGADAGKGVTISDCWTSGTISSTASICGGIAGDIVATGSSIYNCYSTATVTTQFIFGGIVGRAVAGQKSNASNCTNQDPQNHIENCIAWNDLLKSDFISEATPAEHYSSGIIIGGTAIKNYLKNCWHKADIQFIDCEKNTELGTYVPFDQDDASPEVPMVKGEGQYAFAYHGKTAAAGKTLSQVAQEIGWSAEIWDFSGDTPKLK
jgi:hypothetical protein